MYVTSRYVCGRVAMPQPPRILASGKMSHAKNQDMSAASYKEWCMFHEEEEKEDVVEHYTERDKTAWYHTLEFPIDIGMMQSAVQELEEVAIRMRREDTAPPRNMNNCRMCQFKELCHSDPSGDLENWWGLGPRDSNYSGAAPRFRFDDAYRRTITRKTGKLISPSEARTYMACPRKWWIEYKHGLAIQREPWNSVKARTLGSMTHAGCEAVGRAVKGKYDLRQLHMVQYELEQKALTGVIEYIMNDTGTTPEAKMEMKSQAETCALVAGNLFGRAVEGLKSLLHVEQRFAFRIPKTYTWVTCQPDLVGLSPGGRAVLIDYKTTSSSQLDKTAQSYLNAPAMMAYAYAIHNGHPVTPIGA
jgi:CRISPR/Cas system-associated exonuclease Cas4 (RecB family)